MKKNNSIIIGVIVVVIVLVGGYAIFHKSPKPVVTATTTGAAAVNNAVIITKTDASLGQYLAEPSGHALYTYGGDSAGVSNCTGSCLAAWPAYQDTGATTNLPTGISTITRTDNSQVQYTYNGMPLYTFASDSPGQVTGNGVSNFSVAKPIASSSSSSTTPAASSNSTSTNSPY